MNPYALPPLVSASLFLVIGVIALYKSESSAKSPFVLLCFLTVFWQASWAVLFNVQDPAIADLVITIGYSGIIFLPVTYYHFLATYCGARRNLVKVAYAIGAGFLIVHVTSDSFISGHYAQFWGYYPKAGPLHPVYLSLVAVLLSVGAMHIHRAWVKAKRDFRKQIQIKYIALSYALYACAASDFLMNYGVAVYPFGVVFIFASLTCIAYAIAKHNLLDLNLVVKKTALYTALLAILLVPCLGLLYVIEHYLTSVPKYFAYASLVILIGFGFPRIKVQATRNIENLLFGSKVDYQDMFTELSNTVAHLRGLDDLLHNAVEIIADGIGADDLNIYLLDEKKESYALKAARGNYSDLNTEIDKRNINITLKSRNSAFDFDIDVPCLAASITKIPIIYENQLIGFMLIEDWEPLNSENDNTILASISSQLAIAINNSLQFEKIRELNLHLEEKVNERTAELRRAYEELKQLAIVKDEFFSRISHELRTPLTNIMVPIQYVLDEMGDRLHRENRREKEIMLRNASILLKRINEILDIAKLESGYKTIRVQQTNIIDIIEDVVSAAKEAAQRLGVSLKTQYNPLSTLYLDRDKVERVITNILNNAIKFTDSGGSVTVSAAANKPDNEVVVKITDTGIGIRDDQLTNIFTPFHQVESSNTRRYGGTGLGLAICKEFMALHHGSIKVQSRIGVGTTFELMFKEGKDHFRSEEIIEHVDWITADRRSKNRRGGDRDIAILQKDIDKQIWEATRVDRDSVESLLDLDTESKGAEYNILVVEDNQDLANNIHRTLRGMFNVRIAQNGADALNVMESFLPDVIVSDVMMPKMDGMTLCHHVKEDSKRHSIQFILLTARTSTDSKIEGLRAGADYYLQKPFNPRELVAVVQSLLVKKEYQHQVEEQNIALAKATDEMRIAKRDAEKANREKSKFLASMSHELRTPLNAIIGYSEMLAEEVNDQGLQNIGKDLAKIHSSGRYLLSLINNILDLSKIEAGKVSLYIEEFSISSLLLDIKMMTAPLIEKNANQLLIDDSQSPASMIADETKVRQVMINLLSNAAKFTKQGKIQITVKTTTLKNEEFVVFEVADTGIGMDHKQLVSVFKEFSQAEASTSKDYGGTGLGLAISRRFCEMMHGKITAHSELGHGATFTVTLPRDLPSIVEKSKQTNQKVS
jgi:signal transduction histidine kinase